MKIDERVREAYARQRAKASELKDAVDDDIFNRKPSTWHYESRVKTEESYALKVECGRPGDPHAMEDFFGCTIVVPNNLTLGDAEKLVVDLYGLPSYRRPESAETTIKEPSDFRFDDLRLYVTYRDQGFGPPTGLEGILFEVQIKTFLQHAWAVATHNVIYKSDNVSWRRERIAHQARASLEQAEVMISSMSMLETSASLPGTNEKFDLTNAIIEILKEDWSKDELPEDVRRLAEGLTSLLTRFKIANADSFRELLDAGKLKYGGHHNLDWSPYRATIQYLAEQRGAQMKQLLKNANGKYAVFVYPAILELLGLDGADAPRAAQV